MPTVHGPYSYKDNRGRLRQLVNIVNDDGTKRSQSYARFLLEQVLGRELSPDEDADHIDGDPMNNDLSNLRVLPVKINRGQGHVTEWFEFDCPNCGQHACKPARKVRANRKQGKEGPFCGMPCAREWRWRKHRSA